MLLCAGLLASCVKEPAPRSGGDIGQVIDQDFSMGTRADVNGDPEHGDAYTLVSYHVGGTSSTAITRNNITDSRQFGYYAYDDGVSAGTYGVAGALIPVAIRFPVAADGLPPYSSPPMYAPSQPLLTRDRAQAQMLQAVPTTGLNPVNNTGLYRTAVIHPAIPMYNTAGLGFLAVFNLTDDVWASMPDDADGAGTPFEIEVTANGQVHPLPDPTELFPVKSAVKVWFYSEYYSDSDLGKTTPLGQTFNITTLRLLNAGSNGWYNARTGIVYPNYNYQTNWRTVYSSVNVGTAIPNYVDLGVSVVADNVTPGPGPAGNAIQWYVESPVFPSDYRGSEGGGLVQVQPLALQLQLDISGAPLKATVPIAMVVERGMRYNFFINVMSELIAISYNISPWDHDGGSTDDIGGDMIPYLTIPIEYGPGGWDNGGGSGGSDDIGN